MKAIQAIRGMKDIPPAETPVWRRLEDSAREVLAGYGYHELRPPVVEKTELFRRSVGESTDIVEKEMYTFADRNGESLTLRPECTASCVRAAIEHGWLRGRGQRLWHIGPMFRYERPQKGRYRQFHQLDVEALGFPGPDIDAELILLGTRLWRRLGLTGLRLELNSLGSREIQQSHRDRLVDYLSAHAKDLDEDSRRRLSSNPLRILDSKSPDLQAILEAAPRITDCLDDASRRHFEQLQAMLEASDIAFRVNPRLVRGLDYYTGTVFEWITDDLGAQGAICGGGRYDGLVEEIGGAPTPATGFAVGLERVVALMQAGEKVPAAGRPHAYLLAVGEEAQRAAHALAEQLRDALPGLRLLVDAGPGNFKRKMKSADRSGADQALILGEDEVRRQRITCKNMRGDGGQLTVARSEMVDTMKARINLDH
ncbi:MAG: histidine--tRNA ligase [Gammaproteobacteria bacterium]|nr:MAG: histidine--tRNA ligase [Gammaproteobacteria bacterium]